MLYMTCYLLLLAPRHESLCRDRVSRGCVLDDAIEFAPSSGTLCTLYEYQQQLRKHYGFCVFDSRMKHVVNWLLSLCAIILCSDQ